MMTPVLTHFVVSVYHFPMALSHLTINLNWKELEILTRRISAEIAGLFVDRVIIPERPRFSSGYLKGEWGIRLSGSRRECVLLVSVRPRKPYLALISGKGPKAAEQGTRSPFDLAMNKLLKGRRIEGIEPLRRERTLLLRFNDGSALVLTLIPATPEALIVASSDPDQTPWPILASTKVNKEATEDLGDYLPPDGTKAPEGPVVREDLVRSPDSFLKYVESCLETEAFEHRLLAATRTLRDLLKQANDRIRQSETALLEAEKEADWQRYGDLLKGTLGSPAPLENGHRAVIDYETGEQLRIPCDPKLDASQQVEKFYQMARRKKRRIEEARSRVQTFGESRLRYESLLSSLPVAGDWQGLEKLERSAGIIPQASTGPATASKKHGAWLGKTFVSKDGLAIWVGRSRDENLELTFKHARGNDVWLHVRGRPGAHVLVPIQPGKSAPLETLLDAATLAIYYSGGEKWGKTEVDYTFKKYVKRIKDSTEASYTNNKTLLVAPDPTRIKRLLGSQE